MSTADPVSVSIGRKIPRGLVARFAAWLREIACRMDGGVTITIHGVDEDIWHGTLAHAHEAMQVRIVEERHALMLRAAGMLH